MAIVCRAGAQLVTVTTAYNRSSSSDHSSCSGSKSKSSIEYNSSSTTSEFIKLQVRSCIIRVYIVEVDCVCVCQESEYKRLLHTLVYIDACICAK
jgi:hypothetical protein